MISINTSARVTARLVIGAAFLGMAACGGGGGGGGGDSPTPPATTYTISGTVKFMNGAGMVLQNNSENLPISANGSFTFTTALGNNANYAVTVLTPPTGPTQICDVTNGSGVVSGANVTNVLVTCTPWTRQFGTSARDNGRGSATDASGNLYVAGETSDSMDGTNAGGRDLFLVKYDANGARVWTRQLGSVADENSFGATSDTSGNVYVTGSTTGGLDGNALVGGTDIFLVKYDTNGNRQWTRQLGTTANEAAYNVVTDASGNVYIGGETAGNLDGNTSAGGVDLFLTKYDTNGNRLWTRLLGTSAQDSAWDIANDASGNLYLTGTTSGALDGQTNAGGSDGFVVKYDANGNRQWTRLFGTAAFESANGIIVDANGNLYLTGTTFGALDGTNAGVQDVFVAKYDNNGNQQWMRQLGSAALDVGFDIAVDATGNVYAGGRTEGDLDGNTGAGDVDVFVVKYDASGNRQWTRQFGTSVVDEMQEIMTDNAGGIYVSGGTVGGLDGHLNPGVGSRDAFVVKYDDSGVKQ